jgi:hypothetical protein
MRPETGYQMPVAGTAMGHNALVSKLKLRTRVGAFPAGIIRGSCTKLIAENGGKAVSRMR